MLMVCENRACGAKGIKMKTCACCCRLVVGSSDNRGGWKEDGRSRPVALCVSAVRIVLCLVGPI